MFHVQVRRYLPDAVTAAEVLEVQEIQFSGVASATAALTLKVSLAVSDGIRDWIEANPGQAFVVGVEYAVDGGPWTAPRNNLFVAYKGTADDADASETVSITCMDWVSWQLARTYLHWSGSAKNGERTWKAASAGAPITTMIVESKARGWGPRFGRDFSAATDSNGKAWPAADKGDLTYKLLTPVSQVLQALTEQGMCDWWAEGNTLRMFAPGVGTDRTDVFLGGADFARAPGAWDFSNVFTNLTVVPEKARNWLYLTNTGADTSFGRLEATMTQSDVADHPTATRLAQPILAGGRSAKREQTYEWTVTDGMPVPWVDFQLHDLVSIDTAFGPREERVVELVVRVRDDVVTCVAVTGDRMLSAIARKDRRAQAAVIGNIIGGSGNGLPGSNAPNPSAPVAPTSVRVESNTATWRADGTAQATVKIAWDAVTQSEDGAGVDVAGYDVATWTDASEPTTFGTTGVSFTSTDWEPGVRRYVKVRATPQAGSPSAWSDTLVVTPKVPASIVPRVPANLRITASDATFLPVGTIFAQVALAWDAVSLSLDGVPVEVDEYEVTVGSIATRVTAPTYVAELTGGFPTFATVRARTTFGVWSDPTPALDIAALYPPTNIPSPSKPTVTGGLGGITFRWDGKTASGSNMPAGFGHIVVDTGPAVTGPWTRVGTPLLAAGGGTVSAAPGAAVFVRFQAFDTLGREGGMSSITSATSQGIGLGEIPGLADDLNAIRYTADGKNRIFVSPTEPTRETKNLFFDPTFTKAAYTPWAVVAGGIEKTGTGAQNGHYSVASEFPAAPGDRYRVRTTRTDIAGSTGSASVYWQRKNGAGAWVFWTTGIAIPAAGPIVGPWQTVPQDTVAVRIGFYTETNMPTATRVRLTDVSIERAEGAGDQWWVLDPTGTSIVGVKVWNGTAWVNFQIIAQDIIAAGTIKGLHVDAQTIEVNHVSPSFGDDLNLSANEAVTIIVGKQEEQSEKIAGLDDSVTAAQAAANGASSAAGDAQATANGAQTAASQAAAAAAGVGARLDQHQTYYRFGTTGLRIGDPKANAELILEPDRIAMTQNNVVQSEWVGGVLIAPEARLIQASIANHQFLAFGAGRTIIRPL